LMMKSDLRYTTVQSKTTGLDAIKLLEDPYSGIIFTYGKVSFDVDDANDHLKIKFDYDILFDPAESPNNPRKGFVKEDFEQYIGDLLQDLLHEEIAKNNVTYTGGIDDENRTGDIIEPDSE
jgi:hypothetical protein